MRSPAFPRVARLSFTFRLARLALIAAFACGGVFGDLLKERVFQVQFEEEDKDLAFLAVDVLSRALKGIEDRLPPGDEPIRVVICHTHEEFAKYAGRYAKVSVSGAAQSELGLIAVKAPRLVPGESDFEGTLRHELVHVLLARNVNLDHLPRWLNEGMAMTLAREHRWGSAFHIGWMYVQGELIRYRDFDLAFTEPGREMEFGDAYAQALSMTRYLMDLLGDAAFWDLVRDLDTMTFALALRKHAGISPAELWQRWRASLWMLALVFSLVSGFGLFQAMAILSVTAYLRKRRRGRERLRQWEKEEREEAEHPLVLPWELEGREPEYSWEPEDEDDEF